MIQKFLIIVSVLLGISAAGLAQNAPRMEIFGGFSFAKAGFSSTNSPFFLSAVPFGQNFDLRGWEASVSENVDSWFGVTQEFTGLYGNPRLNGFNHNTHLYSFLSGPRFSYRHNERITPFAHALFGYDEISMKIPAAGGIAAKDQSYGMALGGGLDVKLHGVFALRLIQADYYMTQFFGKTQSNLRLSAGIVIQLGRTGY
ncbi:MAG TPA: hypothetical protein VKW70_08265 [Terriglobia bacterium]|nr:hypothetical protein [Terriglobia bacterium]